MSESYSEAAVRHFRVCLTGLTSCALSVAKEAGDVD